MTSPTTSSLQHKLAAFAGAFAALLALGCTQSPKCSELGTCGGNPAGEWALSNGHPSCVEDLYQPPADTRLLKGDQPAARQVPAEVAFFDWCDLLTTNGGDVVQTHEPLFSYEPGSIGAAWIRYDTSLNYAAGYTRTGTYTIEFPPRCMTEFGARTKPDASGALVDVCTQLQASIKPSPKHRNLICAPASDPGACICRFDVSETIAGAGTFAFKDSKTIVHRMNSTFNWTDATKDPKTPKVDFPWEATFCAKGSSLELTGTDGGYLFHEPGLRTLDLGATTINCADGVLGPGEEGVDCGPGCGNICGAPPPAM